MCYVDVCRQILTNVFHTTANSRTCHNLKELQLQYTEAYAHKITFPCLLVPKNEDGDNQSEFK